MLSQQKLERGALKPVEQRLGFTMRKLTEIQLQELYNKLTPQRNRLLYIQDKPSPATQKAEESGEELIERVFSEAKRQKRQSSSQDCGESDSLVHQVLFTRDEKSGQEDELYCLC